MLPTTCLVYSTCMWERGSDAGPTIWVCRRYIDDEIQARDIDSPFRVDGAIMGLFDALLTLRDEGRNITKLLVTVEMLAQVPTPPTISCRAAGVCGCWTLGSCHNASQSMHAGELEAGGASGRVAATAALGHAGSAVHAAAVCVPAV